jgi:hypothetical protein
LRRNGRTEVERILNFSKQAPQTGAD